MHTEWAQKKGLEKSPSLTLRSSYLDLNAIARVDMDAVGAVQEPQCATGGAAQIWRLHKPFALRDVVITQN